MRRWRELIEALTCSAHTGNEFHIELHGTARDLEGERRQTWGLDDIYNCLGSFQNYRFSGIFGDGDRRASELTSVAGLYCTTSSETTAAGIAVATSHGRRQT
jgi:hypothetical protein